MPKEIFIVRNRITLQAAILDWLEGSRPESFIFFTINIIIQQQVN